MWRDIEKTDIERASSLIIPSNIEVSSFYMNEKEDYYNLIKVFKNKRGDDKPRPLIINIHGGGWALKNWVGYEPFYAYFACKGYDSIGFSYYSMLDGYNYVAMVKHIFNVLRYISDNHKKLNVSLDNVFLAGDSAGGQLALFIYSMNKSKELQKIYGVPSPFNIDIKGLILNHPVCFLDDPFINSNNGYIRSTIIKKSFLETLFAKIYYKCAHFSSVNPYEFINIVKKYPPIFLIASEGDYKYKHNTIRLHNTLDELGVDHNYFYEEDKDSRHVYNIALLGSPMANRCNDAIDNFIKSNIKRRNSSISKK